MSAILFRRFLAQPKQIAYVVPSSKALIARALQRMDFTKGRTFVEFGGGEGCITREILTRMAPDAHLLVFELDAELAEHLRQQFGHDTRVHIYQSDAAHFNDELHKLGLSRTDYVISGIPFSYIPPPKKREILHAVHDGLSDDGLFIVYQVTMELKGHGRMFAACEVEYFLANFPPMFILAFHKSDLTVKKKSKRGKKRPAPAVAPA